MFFQGFTEDELINIAIGLAEKEKYEDKKNSFIKDIVKLHLKWKDINKDDIHVFTI